MAETFPFGVADADGLGSSPTQQRQAQAGRYPGSNFGGRPGVLRGMVVSGTASMAYQVTSGHVATARANADGIAEWGNDAATTVATTTAPSSGSRIDIIYAVHTDADQQDGPSAGVLGVAQGAASGSPSAPTLPPGAIELARCTIPSGVTGTQAGALSTQFRQFTAPLGTPIPVTGAAQRNAIGWASPSNVVRVERMDLGVVEVNRGAGWVPDQPVLGEYADHPPPGGPTGLGVGAQREGRYTRIGDMVHGQGFLRMGSGVHNTDGQVNFWFTLPVEARYTNPITIGSAWLFDSSASKREAGTLVLRSATAAGVVTDSTPSYVSMTVPWTLAEGDIIAFDYHYEAA